MKPRAPRVPISPLHRVHFDLESPTHALGLKLSNISTSGIGLIVENNTISPGSPLKGRLVFNQKTHVPIEMKAIHITHGIAGSHYLNPSSDLKKAIQDFFKLELAGLGTMKVNPKYHKKETDGTSAWITGDNCDLYYVAEEDKVIRFKLTFLGNHFTAAQGKPLYVGHVSSGHSSDDEIRYKGSDLLEDVKISKELIESALTVINHIPHLSDAHRSGIIQMIHNTQ